MEKLVLGAKAAGVSYRDSLDILVDRGYDSIEMLNDRKEHKGLLVLFKETPRGKISERLRYARISSHSRNSGEFTIGCTRGDRGSVHGFPFQIF